MHSLEQAIKQAPTAIAIDYFSKKISYEEVYSRSLKVQDILSTYPNNVGLCIKDPQEFIITFIGALLAKKNIFLLNHHHKQDYLNSLTKHYSIDVTLKSLPKKSKNSSINNNKKAQIHLFSSGSTGTPKCIVHEEKQFICQAIASNTALSVDTQSRWLCQLPFFHVSGLSLLFRCFLAKATLVFADSPFDCEWTHSSCVEKQLISLIEHADQLNITPIKAILCGGGPIRRKYIQQSLELKLPLFNCYGMTETASHIAVSLLDKSNIESAGTCLSHSKIRIRNGCLELQSDCLAKGQLQPSGTIDPLVDQNSWYKTNDLANIKKNGTLIIKGRRDNIFISNGENISPEECEAYYRDCPGIESIIIVPVPDKKAGNTLFAFIESKAPLNKTLIQQLESHILKRYSKLYLPKHYCPLKPSNALKVSRDKLKEEALQKIKNLRFNNNIQ